MPQALVKHRKRAGLTQRELAAAIGVKRTAIANYEAGTREPSLERTKLMARVLGTTVEEIEFPGSSSVTNRYQQAIV